MSVDYQAWHIYVDHRDFDSIKRMLSEGVDINHRDPECRNRTALSKAVSKEDIESIELLLEHNADPNVEDKDGDSALNIASCGHVSNKIIKLLIEHGADVNHVGKSKESPLAHSINDLDTVRLLVSHGAKINVQDNHGYTPLHNAVIFSSIKVVHFLLLGGADLTIKNEDGKTPMDVASKKMNIVLLNWISSDEDEI